MEPKITAELHSTIDQTVTMTAPRLAEIRMGLASPAVGRDIDLARELLTALDQALDEAGRWRTAAQNVAIDYLTLRDGPMTVLEIENATLRGRAVAAEGNLAEADKTGRAVAKKLHAVIDAAWPPDPEEKLKELLVLVPEESAEDKATRYAAEAKADAAWLAEQDLGGEA